MKFVLWTDDLYKLVNYKGFEKYLSKLLKTDRRFYSEVVVFPGSRYSVAFWNSACGLSPLIEMKLLNGEWKYKQCFTVPNSDLDELGRKLLKQATYERI